MAIFKGSQAINTIKTLANETGLDSGYRMLGRALENGEWKQEFRNEFYNGDQFRYAHATAGLAGGMIGLRAGYGALKGTVSDSNGNMDIAGIPFI